MKKTICRKTAAIVLITAFLLLLTLFVSGFIWPKEYLSLWDDNVYFDMTPGRLKSIKGEPKEIEKHDVTPYNDYVYSEMLNGFEFQSIYSFHRILWSGKLESASFVCDTIDYDSAKSIINTLSENFSQTYGRKKEYYNKGMVDDGVSDMELSIGTNNGAGGISCWFDYSEGKLSIHIIRQI